MRFVQFINSSSKEITQPSGMCVSSQKMNVCHLVFRTVPVDTVSWNEWLEWFCLVENTKQFCFIKFAQNNVISNVLDFALLIAGEGRSGESQRVRWFHDWCSLSTNRLNVCMFHLCDVSRQDHSSCIPILCYQISVITLMVLSSSWSRSIWIYSCIGWFSLWIYQTNGWTNDGADTIVMQYTRIEWKKKCNLENEIDLLSICCGMIGIWVVTGRINIVSVAVVLSLCSVGKYTLLSYVME